MRGNALKRTGLRTRSPAGADTGSSGMLTKVVAHSVTST